MSVTSTTAASAPLSTFAADTASLTTESLLVYCETRLDSMDGEIRAMMGEQQRAIQQKEVLATLKTEISAASQLESGGAYAALDAFNKAIADLPENDPLRAELETARDTMLLYGGPIDASAVQQEHARQANVRALNGEPQVVDATAVAYKCSLNKDEWTAGLDSVTALSENLGYDAELKMITLQSQVSARQTAISLTTNLLSAVDKSAEAIVGNIR